jgi:diguanylate cyclase (GGDEF)-like protein
VKPTEQGDHAPVVLAGLGLTGIAAVAYFLISNELGQAALLTLGQGAAAVAVVIRIRVRRPERPIGWWLIAAGLGAATVGVALRDGVPALGGSLSSPSAADAAYLCGYSSLVAGLSLVVGGTRRGTRGAALDAAIITVVVAMVAWVIFGDRVDAEHASPAAFAMALAYPAFDLFMLGLVARLLLGSGRRSPAFWLIVGATGATLLDDVLRSVTQTAHVVLPADLVEIAAWLAIACWIAAALQPSTLADKDALTHRSERLTRSRLALLIVAILMAPATLLLTTATTHDSVDVSVIAVASAALGLLVMARLAGIASELGDTLSAREKVETELAHRVLHDTLTGLPNRLQFAERLDAALGRDAGHVAMLFCDLDEFKDVNETLGYLAGDALLSAVAQRLQTLVRPGDLVARLGGDEFGVLLEGIPTGAAAEDIARRLLVGLEEPIQAAGPAMSVHASIGIAVGDPNHESSIELMRNAEIAMDIAKGHGKGIAKLFEPAMYSEMVERISLRADLDVALAARQFVLYYQPIVDLTSDEVHGAEALVRWEHPVRGLLPPSEFIPLAELTGSIVSLGRWVLEAACLEAAQWRLDGTAKRGFTISVNVAAAQLKDPGFVADVKRAIAAAGLERGELTIEVTETVLADLRVAGPVLRELRAEGVRIALDDFGTGYSSLSYIRQLPLDFIKIDRSFISSLQMGKIDASLTATVIELAGKLDVATVAEGIEDAAQLTALKELGCDYGQGYLLSRPIDAGSFRRFMRDSELERRRSGRDKASTGSPPSRRRRVGTAISLPGAARNALATIANPSGPRQN